MIHKKEGFKGQQMVVLPKSVIMEIRKNQLLNGMIITDIGYYPQAEFHFRERKNGSAGNIIIYCVDGSGWCETMGEMRKIQKHTVCVIPAGMPHKYAADPNKPWTIYWMHIQGERANLIVGKKLYTTELGTEVPEVYLQRIRLFDEIYRNYEFVNNLKNIEYANMLAWNFLASIFYQDQYNRKSATKGEKLIDSSLEFMQQNLQTNLTLQEFASNAGLSVSQYSSIFKHHTSTSPMNFFAQLKVQRSCQLMGNSHKRIKEIALELGFEDQFYFSRVFTKIMGISPAKFRKNIDRS